MVIDLEDAVLPDRKSAAREAVHEALSRARDARFIVRVSGIATPWFEEDRRALEGLAGLAGLMLPKAESPDDFGPLGSAKVPLHGLVETARGALNLAALSGTERLVRLSFGTVDFQLDTGIDGENTELDAVRTLLVLHSRVAGLEPPVDGVAVDLEDDVGLTVSALRSKKLGFGGKLCVHPRQVSIVNEAFTPPASAIEWARRVLEASTSGSGAVTIDGKLVDKPVIERAITLLKYSS